MADELLLPLLGHRDDGNDDENSSDSEGSSMEYIDVEPDETSTSASNRDDISYDTSLPAQHIYLGNDLEELSGRTVLEDDCILDLPLLMLPNVVLIPGQTLPLQLYHPADVSMMRRAIAKDKTFGFINQRNRSLKAANFAFIARQMNQNSLPKPRVVGTTAEIQSYKEERDEDLVLLILSIKAEGRQRFEVEKSWRQLDGIIFAKCHILPEILLPESLDSVKLPSSLRFSVKPPHFERLTSQMDISGEECVVVSKATKEKYNLKKFAYLTWWPPWVYLQYDTNLLMKKLINEIKGWDTALQLGSTPSDPTKFSYWIAANIPISDDLKLKLLSLNSSIQRLRAELSILRCYNVLECKVCHHQIVQKDDVFSMSLTGPQGTYVNPGGFVHETITVHKASGIILRGTPSTKYSWFPGYAWIVAECHVCRTHLGWKFVATDKKMKPEMFWGLCRSSLQAQFQKEVEERLWYPCI